MPDMTRPNMQLHLQNNYIKQGVRRSHYSLPSFTYYIEYKRPPISEEVSFTVIVESLEFFQITLLLLTLSSETLRRINPIVVLTFVLWIFQNNNSPRFEPINWRRL